MSIHKEKLNWCLSKSKLMRKIKPDNELALNHIKKAKHNLHACS